jgi:hypothetical protein
MNQQAKFYARCKKMYPFIVHQLMPDPQIADLSDLNVVFRDFCALGGYSDTDVRDNASDALILFIAVSIRLTDPLYFSFEEHTRHSFLVKIGKIVGVRKHKILYHLKKVKEYWQVYPEFQNQVNDIYGKMVKQ